MTRRTILVDTPTKLPYTRALMGWPSEPPLLGSEPCWGVGKDPPAP
jgi:hypothetical protein